MAYQEALRPVSLPQESSLHGSEHLFVKLNSSGRVEVCGAGDDSVGVLDVGSVGPQGSACCVSIAGVAKVVAGAAVNAGAVVMADSSGRAVTASGSGVHHLGRCLKGCSNAGELIQVLLISQYLSP